MKLIFVLALLCSTAMTQRMEKISDEEQKEILFDIIKNRSVLLKDVGCGGDQPKPTGKLAVVAGKCTKGYHKDGNNCVANTDHCNDYDCNTSNCTKCSFWWWRTDSDQTDAAGNKTGNYCRSRIWIWVLIFVGAFLLLLLIVGIIVYFVCGRKKKTPGEKKPLNPKKPGKKEPERERTPPRHVGSTKPAQTHIHTTHTGGDWIEYGEPVITRDAAVVHEVRGGTHYGDRVHVETRTYSPEREMRREVVNDPDWASYSQAHWNEY